MTSAVCELHVECIMFIENLTELTWYEGKTAVHDSITAREIYYFIFTENVRVRLFALRKQENFTISNSYQFRMVWGNAYVRRMQFNETSYARSQWWIHKATHRLSETCQTYNCFRDFQVEFICRDKNVFSKTTYILCLGGGNIFCTAAETRVLNRIQFEQCLLNKYET